jgi:hypothetical protein
MEWRAEEAVVLVGVIKHTCMVLHFRIIQYNYISNQELAKRGIHSSTS